MICFYCNTDKPEELFYRATGKKAKCKQCHSDYIAEYIRSRPEKVKANREYVKKSKPTRKRNRHLLLWKLKAKPCMDCGIQYHPMVMEFDHRPGTDKVAAVSRLVIATPAEQTILDEVKKCDLVCANCHRIRTAIRLRGLEDYEKWIGREGFEPPAY